MRIKFILITFLLGEGLERRLDDTTSESEDQMESGLLLDVVVGESSAILELLTSEDKSLLIWRDSFLVLKNHTFRKVKITFRHFYV